MAKKKVIQKKKIIPEEIKEVKKTDEDIDAFDIDDAPETKEEISDIEQEISEEEKAEFDEEIQEERFYVIPLAKKGYEKTPRWKNSKKAIKVVRQFLERHMKPEGEVYISQDVNERVWENGIKNTPRKIRVRVTKSVDGIVRAYLA